MGGHQYAFLKPRDCQSLDSPSALFVFLWVIHSHMHLNIEIKARSQRLDQIRETLNQLKAEFKGLDHQVDTYFSCPAGRLKLRDGTIERSLIFYQRTDQAGPKASEVYLHQVDNPASLKAVLAAAYGIWQVVDKQREIYFIQNVKFHLDEVAGLGTFVEIEAIDEDGSIGKDRLMEQCTHYMTRFQIETADLLTHSYSDMLANVHESK